MIATSTVKELARCGEPDEASWACVMLGRPTREDTCEFLECVLASSYKSHDRLVRALVPPEHRAGALYRVRLLEAILAYGRVSAYQLARAMEREYGFFDLGEFLQVLHTYSALRI